MVNNNVIFYAKKMLHLLLTGAITRVFTLILILAMVITAHSTAQEFETFENFETFEEEGTNDVFVLSDTDTVYIEHIIINIDGNIYRDSSNNTDIQQEKDIPRLEILYASIDARRGQTYSVRALTRKIKFWILRINGNPYYENADIQILPSDSSSQKDQAITLFITASLDHKYAYFGGNAYAGFGIKHTNGLQSTFYLGGNRIEYAWKHDSIVPKKLNNYSRLALVTGGHVFGYWDFISSWTNAFIYGADAYFGIRPLPSSTFTLGSGFFAYSNVFENFTDTQNEHLGLPNYTHSSLSTQLQSSVDLRVPFNKVGWYTTEIGFSLPLMWGLWNRNIDDALSPYFSAGIFTTERLAFKFGVPQALTLRASYVNSILVFNQAPFHAKANIKHGFYNNYGFRMEYGRRGSGYAETLYVGNHGSTINLEYGIMVLSRRIVGLETYIFYDTGFVSNTYDEVLDNIRHTTGTGLSLFIGSPVNIVFKLSLGIGGDVLNNKRDGNAIGVDFSAEFN